MACKFDSLLVNTILYNIILYYAILCCIMYCGLSCDYTAESTSKLTCFMIQNGGLCILVDIESWYRVSMGAGYSGSCTFFRMTANGPSKVETQPIAMSQPEPRIHQPSAAKVASKLSRRSTDASMGEQIHWNIIRGNNIKSNLSVVCHGLNSNPIGSMYGIYTNIGDIVMVNATIYSIHGSYGNMTLPTPLYRKRWLDDLNRDPDWRWGLGGRKNTNRTPNRTVSPHSLE